MRIGVFDAKPFDKLYLSTSREPSTDFDWVYFEPRLSQQTVDLVNGIDVVCVFVHDTIDRCVMTKLKERGVRLIALRCAGFNNVDLEAAKELGIPVVRVPAYSPFSVAEFAVGMMLSLNRKYHRAYQRVREGNYAINGLLGFDMHGRTAGVIGTGKIGEVVCRILKGFGCRVVAHDVTVNPAVTTLEIPYLPLDSLLEESDIISLHCPLLTETHYLINEGSIAKMKSGVMLINTSRGGLVDTAAVIRALKSQQIGFLGLDVYEEEEDLFFADRSAEVLQDDIFARLLTFPNVLITAHQAFFTRDALEGIARTTQESLDAFRAGSNLKYQILPPS